MRILITGMTPAQCGKHNTCHVQSKLLLSALTELGHQVDLRPVEYGEEGLRERYDFAIVGVSSLLTFTSAFRFGGIWAIDQLPSILFHDDNYFPKSLSTYNPEKHYVIRTQGMADNSVAELKKCMERGWPICDVAIRTAARIVSGEFDFLWVVYPTGIDSVIRSKWPQREIYRWDPRPHMAKPPMRPRPDVKIKRWVLASLGNQDDWLSTRKLSWPVVRMFKATGARFDNRQPEVELISNYYVPNWGALIFGQPHLIGVGWHRPRHMHAIWAGMVQWGEAREVHQFGKSWTKLTGFIESLDDAGLAQLAQEQAREFTSNMKSREDNLLELKAAVELWCSRNLK